MSVSDGQLANASNFNSSFLSRKTDSDTIGVVGLNNTTDANSGAQITNTQRAINETFDACGITGEGDASANVYATNNIITDGDTYKEALEALDANTTTYVVGPVSAGDENLAIYDGVTGKLIKDSGVDLLDVVLKTATQALTNKEYDGGTASDTSRIKLPKDTTTNLDLLTDFQGLFAYDTTLDKPVFNTGAGWFEVGGGAGGGGGGLVWSAPDGVAPVNDEAFDQDIYIFEDVLAQRLEVSLKVPNGYTSGNQIYMYIGCYLASTSNTFKMQTTATLVRKNTDAINDATNQHTSTNSALTSTVSNQYREIQLDLTNGSGQINSVGVSAGDIIRVSLERASGTTDPGDVNFIPSATEVTFS